MYGFAGKILRVDLSKRTLREEPLDAAVARTYVGGRGLGARIMFEELAPGIDPLGPDNNVIFATGPVTGTAIPGNTRFIVLGKSPLTGLFGESNCSGSFGRELKKAGYDAVVVGGKAETPAYLWINDGRAEIRDAGHLWGKTTGETDDALKQEVGDKRAWVACIGPAGERLVKYAAILSDKHKAAGRTGLGAVMGAKNLKAVVARGTGEVPVAQPEKVKGLARWMNRDRHANPGAQQLATYGTSGGIPGLQAQGILPTKNFQSGVFAGAEKISGQALARTILTGTIRCEGCPIPHHRQVDLKDSPYGPIDGRYGGAEYETVAAFGSLCLIDDLVAINAANQLCNAYGIDTISAGVVVAWAMECYEKGILSAKDLGGVAARWGDGRAVLALLEQIGRREGGGDLLAEGVRAAAQRVGQGSAEFAMHVRGLELALHDPRGKKGLTLIYTAASPRGACHTEAAHDTSFERPNAVPEAGIVAPLDRLAVEGKGELMRKACDLHTALNSLSLCQQVIEPAMGRFTLSTVVEIVAAITGWEDLTAAEVLAMGERANNLARAWNVREGSDRRDDVLPARFREGLPEGGSAGETVSLEDQDRLLDDFYAACGWTEDGVPSEQKLQALDLGYVAEALRASGALAAG
ncbi:MAG: aldehyde ferredoxin oxidoreductase family protein [Chloroflexi bacterium]|nr:aldehyde ferredoxin oxidoreductase family protein [Chloroflexota bacterium]